jgi:hypothetical protein
MELATRERAIAMHLGVEMTAHVNTALFLINWEQLLITALMVVVIMEFAATAGAVAIQVTMAVTALKRRQLHRVQLVRSFVHRY